MLTGLKEKIEDGKLDEALEIIQQQLGKEAKSRELSAGLQEEMGLAIVLGHVPFAIQLLQLKDGPNYLADPNGTQQLIGQETTLSFAEHAAKQGAVDLLSELLSRGARVDIEMLRTAYADSYSKETIKLILQKLTDGEKLSWASRCIDEDHALALFDLLSMPNLDIAILRQIAREVTTKEAPSCLGILVGPCHKAIDPALKDEAFATQLLIEAAWEGKEEAIQCFAFHNCLIPVIKGLHEKYVEELAKPGRAEEVEGKYRAALALLCTPNADDAHARTARQTWIPGESFWKEIFAYVVETDDDKILDCISTRFSRHFSIHCLTSEPYAMNLHLTDALAKGSQKAIAAWIAHGISPDRALHNTLSEYGSLVGQAAFMGYEEVLKAAAESGTDFSRRILSNYDIFVLAKTSRHSTLNTLSKETLLRNYSNATRLLLTYNRFPIIVDSLDFLKEVDVHDLDLSMIVLAEKPLTRDDLKRLEFSDIQLEGVVLEGAQKLPLSIFVKSGDLDTVESRLQRDVHAGQSVVGSVSLLLILAITNKEMVRLLVRHGARPNPITFSTALASQDRDLIQLLLTNIDTGIATALLPCAVEYKDLETVNAIFARNLDPDPKSALGTALSNTSDPEGSQDSRGERSIDNDLIDLLLSRTRTYALRHSKSDWYIEPFLRFRSQRLYSYVRQMLDYEEVDINVRDICGKTILHEISIYYSQDLLKSIFEKKHPDVNIQDNYGQTPLYIMMSLACRDEERFEPPEILEEIKLLLQHDADPKISDQYGESPESMLNRCLTEKPSYSEASQRFSSDKREKLEALQQLLAHPTATCTVR